MKKIIIMVLALYKINSPTPVLDINEKQVNDYDEIETAFNKIKPFFYNLNESSYQDLSQDVLMFLQIISKQNYTNYYDHYDIDVIQKLKILTTFLEGKIEDEYDKYKSEIKIFLTNNFTKDIVNEKSFLEKFISFFYEIIEISNQESEKNEKNFFKQLNELKRLDEKMFTEYNKFIEKINDFINNTIKRISNCLSIITDISFHPILYKTDSYDNLMITILQNVEYLNFFLNEKKLIISKLTQLLFMQNDKTE